MIISKDTSTRFVVGSLFAVVLTLSGCANNPETMSELESARQRYDTIAQVEDVHKYAAVELQAAEDAVKRAETLIEQGADKPQIDHQLKIASIRMDIVKEKLRHERAQEYISNADSNRKDILLQARENEVVRAKREARDMEMKVETAEMEKQRIEEQNKQLEDQARQLQAEIKEVKTKQTERGVVLTLGDILFAFGKADLMKGHERKLDEVAKLLNDYPERRIVIEGHTDSVGDEEYNKELSKDRALSVKEALVEYGVDESRVVIKGMGEEYPVANNSTQQGRQQNRRVDIVIENQEDEEIATY